LARRQADKYFASLYEHFDRIAENPLAFPAFDPDRLSRRRCALKSHTIYFQISETGTVFIIAILGRQDPDSFL